MYTFLPLISLHDNTHTTNSATLNNILLYFAYIHTSAMFIWIFKLAFIDTTTESKSTWLSHLVCESKTVQHIIIGNYVRKSRRYPVSYLTNVLLLGLYIFDPSFMICEFRVATYFISLFHFFVARVCWNYSWNQFVINVLFLKQWILLGTC